MTPSTNGPSPPCWPAPAPERSTTNIAPPATPTTKPCAPSATASSASCTAAYATTSPTTNTPPGHIAKTPEPLDNLRTWDVYTTTTRQNIIVNDDVWTEVDLGVTAIRDRHRVLNAHGLGA